MGFWNYLGLSCLYEMLFGRKRRCNAPRVSGWYDHTRDGDCVDELSDRIDALDHRLDGIDPDSELYDDLDTELRDFPNDIYDDDLLDDASFDDDF